MPWNVQSLPCMRWNVRVAKTHSPSASPPTPIGFSRLCCGPAPNPSMEIDALTLTLDMDRAPIALGGALEVQQVGIERALESRPRRATLDMGRETLVRGGAAGRLQQLVHPTWSSIRLPTPFLPTCLSSPSSRS